MTEVAEDERDARLRALKASIAMEEFAIKMNRLLTAATAMPADEMRAGEMGMAELDEFRRRQSDRLPVWAHKARQDHPEIVRLLGGKVVSPVTGHELAIKKKFSGPKMFDEHRAGRSGNLTSSFGAVTRTNDLKPGTQIADGRVFGGFGPRGEQIFTTPRDIEGDFGRNKLMTAEQADEYIKGMQGAFGRDGWRLPTLPEMQEIIRNKDEGRLATTINTIDPNIDNVELNQDSMAGIYLTSTPDPHDGNLMQAVRASDGKIFMVDRTKEFVSIRPICTEASGTEAEIASGPAISAPGKDLAVISEMEETLQDNALFRIIADQELTRAEKIVAIAEEFRHTGKRLMDFKCVPAFQQFASLTECFVSLSERLGDEVRKLRSASTREPRDCATTFDFDPKLFLIYIERVARGEDPQVLADFAQNFVNREKTSRDRALASLTEARERLDSLESAHQTLKDITEILYFAFCRAIPMQPKVSRRHEDIMLAYKDMLRARSGYVTQNLANPLIEKFSLIHDAKADFTKQIARLRQMKDPHITLVCAAYDAMNKAAEEMGGGPAPVVQAGIAPARNRAITARPRI